MVHKKARLYISIGFVLLVIASVFVALAAFSSPDAPEASGYSGTLTILTSPDIHSHIFSMGENDTGSRMGRITTLADSMGEEENTTLFLFAGDLGEGPFYHTFGGEPEATACGMAGVDAAVPGNHAFDYSTGFFCKTLSHTPYPVVCANLDFDDPALGALVKDSVLLDAGGAKVGVFGIITPKLWRIVTPDGSVRLLTNTTDIAVMQVANLEEQGADMVIAMTHQDKDEDLRLASETAGIDLIIGGHDHLVWNETVTGTDGEETLIVHAGKYGEEVAAVTLLLDNGEVVATGIERQDVTINISSDPRITGYLDTYYRNYTKTLSETIGTFTRPLDLRMETLRTGEAEFGDFATDSVRKAIAGVDVCLLNAGSMRGDRVIPAGNVTYLTLDSIFPFENSIVIITMTGEELRETLELSASALPSENETCPEENRPRSGAFLQVSGISFTIETDRPGFCAEYSAGGCIISSLSDGERIGNLTLITPNGPVPVDPAANYTVAVNDYLAGGGDGYSNLKEIPASRKFSTEIRLINILAERIAEESPVTVHKDGRIRVL